MPGEDWDEYDDDLAEMAYEDDESEDELPVRCPECGGDVYELNDMCPACGYWLTEADRASRWNLASRLESVRLTARIAIGLFVALLIVALLASAVWR